MLKPSRKREKEQLGTINHKSVKYPQATNSPKEILTMRKYRGLRIKQAITSIRTSTNYNRHQYKNEKYIALQNDESDI